MSKELILVDNETDLSNAAEDLEALNLSAFGYLGNSKAENTKKAYESDWRDFQNWCLKFNLISLPATAHTINLYLSSLALSGIKVATIQRRVSALVKAHEYAKYENPVDITVRDTVAGIRREHGSKETGKKPILVEMIKQMINQVPENNKGIRDKSLLLLGFAGAFRRSELTALDVEDIQESSGGLIVQIKKSKTDQEGEGELIGIPYGSQPLTCPVQAYLNWLKISGIQNGPIFRKVNRHGQIGINRLSDRAVADVIKLYIRKCGFDADDFSGHSLRSGLATSAAMAGKNEREIMGQTRHTSEKMVRKYIRMGTLFHENAAKDIGL
ncbi:site-specific recombinase XerD [Paenibacillus sp. PastF-3]|uniref:site-specific integrase n=1 Tax=Paenibacillus sp. PastF-3 TaxID=2940626 RepID=UPI002473A21F|nr:site-specific integrase [Paenibacillus sp. PastF-3]MDH6372899.1 site-specific recombinase XerD [Paenibacillus sp. PastF-3]